MDNLRLHLGDQLLTISETYRNIFFQRLRQILAWGCELALARIQPNEEEDTITQYIKEEIETVTQDAFQNPDSRYPAWCKSFIADDQVLLSNTSRRGKHRLKVDLRISLHTPNQIASAFFEAKRLYENSGVPDYMGKEGMGCFLEGSYPSPLGRAYMLGYVQNKTSIEWGIRIKKALVENKDCMGLIGTKDEVLHSSIPQEWSSRHQMKHMKEILVCHILLDCTCS